MLYWDRVCRVVAHLLRTETYEIFACLWLLQMSNGFFCRSIMAKTIDDLQKMKTYEISAESLLSGKVASRTVASGQKLNWSLNGFMMSVHCIFLSYRM